jgi:hypothetical protein
MRLRGLLLGGLMLVLGALFAWGLGAALERRAEKGTAGPTDVAMPSSDKNHWMF